MARARYARAGGLSATRAPASGAMQFRRVPSLPPYVFAVTEQLKLELRRAGDDVIDLGFGNPDLPSPPRRSTSWRRRRRSHGTTATRQAEAYRSSAAAICDLYADRFGVELDPETQAVATIGAKEGLAHLMWVLVSPATWRSCRALVSDPPLRAHPGRGERRPVELGTTTTSLRPARRRSRDRVHARARSSSRSRTTRRRAWWTSASWNGSWPWRARTTLSVVHDFAYADITFDGYRPPSILQVRGAARSPSRSTP